jgi:hypothetical protein
MLMDAGVVTQLLKLYEALPRGRLVIVGEGGTGKTGALIRLLLKATAARRRDQTKPVPVLLTASDWDPRPDPDALASWVTATIYRQHGYLRNTEKYGAGVVEQLLNVGAVAAFIDGLDEMDEDRRPHALNAIATETRFRVVLTSRPAELDTAAAKAAVVGAEVVSLLNVPPDVGGSWLQQDQRGPLKQAWAEFADAMNHTHPMVADALNSPLWLTLARACYTGSTYRTTEADPSELLNVVRFSTIDSVRAHLLDRTIANELADSPYATSGRDYLAFVAAMMGERTELTWWRVRNWVPWLPISIAASACGAGAAIIAGFHSSARYGLVLGGTLALLSSVVGAAFSRIVGRRGRRSLSGDGPRQGVAIALGLTYGLGFTLITKLESGDLSSLWAAAIVGGVLGVANGLTIGSVALHDGPLLAVRRLPSAHDVKAGLTAGAACCACALFSVEPVRALALGLS